MVGTNLQERSGEDKQKINKLKALPCLGLPQVSLFTVVRTITFDTCLNGFANINKSLSNIQAGIMINNNSIHSTMIIDHWLKVLMGFYLHFTPL